jgi:hypothetical protein
MPNSKQWNQTDIEAAFNTAIAAAVGDKQLRRELLNAATAKNVFAKAADIDVPDDVEVIFFREEDLPLRMVMAIPCPALPNHRAPTFKGCFLCTYDTYVTRTAADAVALNEMLRKLKLL